MRPLQRGGYVRTLVALPTAGPHLKILLERMTQVGARLSVPAASCAPCSMCSAVLHQRVRVGVLRVAAAWMLRLPCSLLTVDAAGIDCAAAI